MASNGHARHGHLTRALSVTVTSNLLPMSHSLTSTIGTQPYQVVVRRKIRSSDQNINQANFSRQPLANKRAKAHRLTAPSGFVVGGALGCVVGMGAMAIPGLFIAGGPLATAGMGIAVGVITGMLTGLTGPSR